MLGALNPFTSTEQDENCKNNVYERKKGRVYVTILLIHLVVNLFLLPEFQIYGKYPVNGDAIPAYLLTEKAIFVLFSKKCIYYATQ